MADCRTYETPLEAIARLRERGATYFRWHDRVLFGYRHAPGFPGMWGQTVAFQSTWDGRWHAEEPFILIDGEPR